KRIGDGIKNAKDKATSGMKTVGNSLIRTAGKPFNKVVDGVNCITKNLVVKEILNTGIIHSMQEVLEVTQKQVQPYLVTEKAVTQEVNSFPFQTENSSYPHLHRQSILTYQKERKY